MSALVLILSGLLAGQSASIPPNPPPKAGVESSEIRVQARFTPLAAHKAAPYELVHGHIVLKAVVAGRDVWALVDTGAERSLIDTALAADAGLRIDAPQGTVRTSTGSSIPKRRVSDVEIKIPDQLEIHSPAVAGLDMTAMSAAMGRKVEFVLGADFLSMAAVKLDPAKRTLDLYPSGVLRPPAGFPSLPLKGGYRIEVLVDGKPVLVELDLGASGALTLEPATWARVGPANARVERGGTLGVDGRERAVDFGVLPAVSVGNNRYTNVRTQIMPWPGDDTEGAIGMDLLDQLFIVLDAKAGTIWLAPPAGSSRGG
ncbi:MULTISPECIES: pepsin/retropepsin-like aspartic protease family protein [unclassified Caulobacter]|uniref:pepsin/retropepsin-like aspartic protease family protein n=1 Tax=unclassified Caulobacter TaxID=2648921 RepID=UPI0006FEFBCF|nr:MULTISPECIES: pepsin/retropepsin-like aspartic protease family protein [unclassified Caulobacter]KQV71139.1 hypothetical protein ASC70_05965 [Caulobacter sp. Root343]